MKTIKSSTTGWLKKGSVSLLFFIVESMVFAIITLSPYLSKTTLFGFHTGLTAVLLIIQKSDSLWGAALFHAAGDCLIIFGAFTSM